MKKIGKIADCTMPMQSMTVLERSMGRAEKGELDSKVDVREDVESCRERRHAESIVKWLAV